MRSDEYKIEKGVKLQRSKREGVWVDLVDKMVIGDSVFIKTKRESSSLASAIRKRGFKGPVRVVDGGFRVWKQAKS